MSDYEVIHLILIANGLIIEQIEIAHYCLKGSLGTARDTWKEATSVEKLLL